MPQALDEPRTTLTRAIENLENCLKLTESLVGGNPMNEKMDSTAIVASNPLVRNLETVEEMTKRLAEVNQKLTLL